MKQDEFENLRKLVDEMEAEVQTKADEQMLQAIRHGVSIVERLVTALERIAAHTAPMVITSAAPATKISEVTIDWTKGPIAGLTPEPRG